MHEREIGCNHLPLFVSSLVSPMLIATWNVNSAKARLETIVAWLKEASPDVACFQELKCEDQAFPRQTFEDLGYNVAVHGQKTYNGVAILSKQPFDEVKMRLPGDDGDEQARYVEAVVSGIRVASIYLPNGNPVASEKYAYKLAWMDRLINHANGLLKFEEPLVLAGDYNVIPEDRDTFSRRAMASDALFQPESQAAFRRLVNLYDQALKQYGKEQQPIGVHSPGYVGESDAEAREQIWPHYAAMHTRIGRERGWGPMTRAQFEHAAGPTGALYVGSPETVAAKIVNAARGLRLSRFDLKYSAGTLAHDKLMRCMELYGSKVMPLVRDMLA